MNFHRTQKVIKKKVKDAKPEMIPALVIEVKPLSAKKFEISIIHPNTKKVLYSKPHFAKDVNEAFALGRKIRETKFSDTKTWYEEILHIPRPKRGKMKLKTKDDA